MLNPTDIHTRAFWLTNFGDLGELSDSKQSGLSAPSRERGELVKIRRDKRSTSCPSAFVHRVLRLTCDELARVFPDESSESS